MAKNPIKSTELKNIISQMEKYPFNKMLISVNWGLWNVAASLAFIYNIFSYKTIVTTTILGGFIVHIIISLFFNKKQGYIQKKDTIYSLIWFLILIAMFQITVIHQHFAAPYNRQYSLVFIILLAGIGLTITGPLLKLKSTTLFGLMWIISANIMVYKVEYAFYIHGFISFLTLVVMNIIRYGIFYIKRKRDIFEKKETKTQPKEIMTKIGLFPLHKALISVVWGILNSIAAIIFIFQLAPEFITWIIVIIIGIILSIIILSSQKNLSKYEMAKHYIYKKIWGIIIFVIIDVAFIFPAISPFYNINYKLVLADVFIGIGISLTGKLYEQKITVIAGIIWLLSTNRMSISMMEYRYHIHLLISIIILIILQPILYIKNKKLNKQIIS